MDESDLRGPWLGELLCGNLDESFKFLTCWRAELKAELDIVECVLFEKLTPEGMCYAARGHSDWCGLYNKWGGELVTIDCTDDVICATEQRFIFGFGIKNILSIWMNWWLASDLLVWINLDIRSDFTWKLMFTGRACLNLVAMWDSKIGGSMCLRPRRLGLVWFGWNGLV